MKPNDWMKEAAEEIVASETHIPREAMEIISKHCPFKPDTVVWARWITHIDQGYWSCAHCHFESATVVQMRQHLDAVHGGQMKRSERTQTTSVRTEFTLEEAANLLYVQMPFEDRLPGSPALSLIVSERRDGTGIVLVLTQSHTEKNQ